MTESFPSPYRNAPPRRMINHPPPTPSFGLFLPTPSPASGARLPYIHDTPPTRSRHHDSPFPNISRNSRRAAPLTQALQPRYHLRESTEPSRVILEYVHAEAVEQSTPTPTVRRSRPLPTPLARPPPSLPRPDGSIGEDRNASPLLVDTALLMQTPPRFLPPRHTRAATPLSISTQLPQHDLGGVSQLPQEQYGRTGQEEYRASNGGGGVAPPNPLAGLQPGQHLTTSSTQYCRLRQAGRGRHIESLSRTDISAVIPSTKTAPKPTVNSARINAPAPPTGSKMGLNRPTGPRTQSRPESEPVLLPTESLRLMRQAETMRRNHSSSSSGSTDLHRRSAIRSLPPTRDYSSSSNRSKRNSLVSTILQDPIYPQIAIATTQSTEVPELDCRIFPAPHATLYASPPQADFAGPSHNPSSELEWVPEPEDPEDLAQAAWRRVEQRLGRRLSSGHEAHRGRWVMRDGPGQRVELDWAGSEGGNGEGMAAEMSPGQFTLSDYMPSSREASGEGWDDGEMKQAMEGEMEVDEGYPFCMSSTGEMDITPRQYARYGRQPIKRPEGIPNSFEQPIPNTSTSHHPPSPGLRLFREKTQKHHRNRSSMCRLDTQIVSALQALKTDWASPELDIALLENADGMTPSPEDPSPPISPHRQRVLPRLPQLALSRSPSPPEQTIVTPTTNARALPTPPPPMTPREKGLGLGMHIRLNTTYGLPKPSLSPLSPIERPLPSPPASPVPVHRPTDVERKQTPVLIRKGTIRVERAPSMKAGVFVIRDLDTGEAREVGMEELEAVLADMAKR